MAGDTRPARGRLTQRDIARLAGVSQTTVSLVLNNRAEGDARIPARTRDRVLKVIRETGYVADPLARRLLQQRNQILGVFTYESVFPSATADFYHPFLRGIEEAAEEFGCDLLLFTSASASAAPRRIFGDNNRLRLADGCLLLGREVPQKELARLVTERYPFVSIGRRDDAEGPVPYVGVDYVAGTIALVERARALGHRRLAFVGPATGAESSIDRRRGFVEAAGRMRHEKVSGRSPSDVLDSLLRDRVTAAFVEDMADAVPLVEAALARDIDVPRDLSVVTLGDPTRPLASPQSVWTDPVSGFSGFHIPRREMGREAVRLLEEILSGTATKTQLLLPCELVEGSTLAPVERSGKR